MNKDTDQLLPLSSPSSEVKASPLPFDLALHRKQLQGGVTSSYIAENWVCIHTIQQSAGGTGYGTAKMKQLFNWCQINEYKGIHYLATGSLLFHLKMGMIPKKSFFRLIGTMDLALKKR